MAAFPVPRRRVRLVAALLATVALLPLPVAVAAGGPGAGSPAVGGLPAGAGSGTPGGRADAPGSFSLDLAEDGDYVRQTNFVQCVGASVQMMLNIAEPGADRYTQDAAPPPGPGALAQWAESGRERAPGRRGHRLGGGAQPQRRTSRTPSSDADTLQDAMQIAARAIVTYRRPVGPAGLAGPARLGDERLRVDRRPTRRVLPCDPGLHPGPAPPTRVQDSGDPARSPARRSASRRSAASSSGGGSTAAGTRCPGWQSWRASTSSWSRRVSSPPPEAPAVPPWGAASPDLPLRSPFAINPEARPAAPPDPIAPLRYSDRRGCRRPDTCSAPHDRS